MLKRNVLIQEDASALRSGFAGASPLRASFLAAIACAAHGQETVFAFAQPASPVPAHGATASAISRYPHMP